MPRVPRTDDVKVTSAVATGLAVAPLNAPAVSDVMDVRDSSQIGVNIDFVRGGAATAVVTTVEVGSAVGGPFFVLQDVTAGAATPLTITRTTSVSEQFAFQFDVTAFEFVRLTFNGTVATAADTVTVTVDKTRGD